jgi:hypothetical protein
VVRHDARVRTEAEHRLARNLRRAQRRKATRSALQTRAPRCRAPRACALDWLTWCRRKRNWRFRLLVSIVSMSICAHGEQRVSHDT